MIARVEQLENRISRRTDQLRSLQQTVSLLEAEKQTKEKELQQVEWLAARAARDEARLRVRKSALLTRLHHLNTIMCEEKGREDGAAVSSSPANVGTWNQGTERARRNGKESTEEKNSLMGMNQLKKYLIKLTV